MNKQWVVIKFLVVVMAMALCGVASAGPGSGPGMNPEVRLARHAGKAAEREEKREVRQAEREQKADMRRGNRLTPEERRDLRRQINKAGQDLYQDAPKN